MCLSVSFAKNSGGCSLHDSPNMASTSIIAGIHVHYIYCVIASTTYSMPAALISTDIGLELLGFSPPGG